MERVENGEVILEGTQEVKQAKEKAINFADNFKKKGKLNKDEYKSIMLFIEATYE